jgi:hypothetical protein
MFTRNLGQQRRPVTKKPAFRETKGLLGLMDSPTNGILLSQRLEVWGVCHGSRGLLKDRLKTLEQPSE